MFKSLAHQFLKSIPAEAAHDLAVKNMKKGRMASGPYIDNDNHTMLFGAKLNNLLGLAAGFDKNGYLVDVIQNYGFGFVEVGSITLRGGNGNPKPRMFRLDKRDVMNRMGLNGEPAGMIVNRLEKVKSYAFAVNIAKTHDPEIVGDKAIEDIVGSFKLASHLGIYTALNISCPNTKEGKTFEDPAALEELLRAVDPHRNKPLVIKLSPTDDMYKLERVLQICAEMHIDGYICSNTLPWNDPRFGRGGRSGTMLRPLSLEMVGHIKAQCKVPVIGCGGIFSAHHYRDYRVAGADACQAYNGFVRGPHAGPDFAHACLKPEKH